MIVTEEASLIIILIFLDPKKDVYHNQSYSLIELVKENEALLQSLMATALPEAKTKSLNSRSAAVSKMMRFLPALRCRQQHILALNSQAREIETSCSRKLQEINQTAVVHN